MIYENINVFWSHYKGHGNGNEVKRNKMERIKYKVAIYVATYNEIVLLSFCPRELIKSDRFSSGI